MHTAIKAPAKAEPVKPTQGDLWGSGTVLLVKDEAMVRQGYTVLTAENGEAALELLEKSDKPDMPILFMSGYTEEQLCKSIDLDNVAFLPKPFSVQQLAEAARSVFAAK